MTSQFGLQASTAFPFIARTRVVQRTTGDVPFLDEVRGVGDTTSMAVDGQRGPISAHRSEARATVPS